MEKKRSNEGAIKKESLSGKSASMFGNMLSKKGTFVTHLIGASRCKWHGQGVKEKSQEDNKK